MPNAVSTLITTRFPGHVVRWQELVEAGLLPFFYDTAEDWLVYIAIGASQLAYVTVDPAKDTVRLIRLPHVIGSALLDEADATSLTLHVAAPVSILTLRATVDPGRQQLRGLHLHLLHHPHAGSSRG